MKGIKRHTYLNEYLKLNIQQREKLCYSDIKMDILHVKSHLKLQIQTCFPTQQ